MTASGYVSDAVTKPVVGQALCGRPAGKDDFIHWFDESGSAVAQTAASHIAPTLLELGGKNAFLVFDDDGAIGLE